MPKNEDGDMIKNNQGNILELEEKLMGQSCGKIAESGDKIDLSKFEWIFFDIGGVLADESKANELRMQADLEIIQRHNPEVSMQDIVDAYWSSASASFGDIDRNLFRIFLQDEVLVKEAVEILKERKKTWPSYHERNFIRPEAQKVLEALSKKHKLGIIANQPKCARKLLEDAGIEKYFTFTGLSDEHDLHKPDPAFFEKVLQYSGADPKTAVMIDDSVERGILPAKKLGLATIRFKGGQNEKNANITDFEIDSLEDLL